jgi:hypothetical protein
VDARILVVEKDLTATEVVVGYLRNIGLEPGALWTVDELGSPQCRLFSSIRKILIGP